MHEIRLIEVFLMPAERLVVDVSEDKHPVMLRSCFHLLQMIFFSSALDKLYYT